MLLDSNHGIIATYVAVILLREILVWYVYFSNWGLAF
jgi:hypothetical protein